MSLDIDALISNAKKEQAEAGPEELHVLLGGEVVVIRLWPLSGPDWRALFAKHPPRTMIVDEKPKTLTADVPFGCNIDSLVRDYPRVALVKGDEEQELDKRTWRRILDVLPADGISGVAATAIWLNVAEPAHRHMEAQGKAARAGEQTKPASPDSSE